MSACGVALMLAFIVSPAFAVDLNQKINFTIPPQRLSTALLEFSHQAKVQIIVGPEIGERKTGGVTGIYALGDALRSLLDGSSLGFRVINDTSITVGSPASIDKQPTGASPATGSGNGAAGTSREPVLAQADSTGTAGKQHVEAANVPESKAEVAQKEGLTEIVVTGTHIHGTDNKINPVIVIDRDQIDRSGYSSTADLFRSLPQNFQSAGASEDGWLNPTPTSPINTDFGTAVNLRGLGPSSTLVLLNGHRVAPSSSGTFVDVSQIPLSAIDRVEILTDGSSAIYGSDAVGGVVNIILKKDYQGADTSVRYAATTSGERD
jgi:outer membrane receptor protein involved in Fe transport